jgi:UDPglucose 6-dehydrogenase
MRIGIIGYGFVGKAIAAAHDRKTLMINDPNVLEEWESFTVEQIVANTGWIYLCLPTPSNEDGSCDTSILENMFEQLKNYQGIVISKSTAPPKFYIDAFNNCGPEQSKKYKFRLVHMPEFLTAANALHDYMHPHTIVVGGKPVDNTFVLTHAVTSDLTYRTKAKIVSTDIGSAAAMKYYANSWLATKVVYNNQFAQWCKSQGVEWKNVAEVLKKDKRIGDTHYDVPGPDTKFGYGGACFPKDVASILAIAEASGIDMSLLKHQVEVNERLRAIDTSPPKPTPAPIRQRANIARRVAPTRGK